MAFCLAQGEIGLAVHREGGHGRVSGEDRGAAVALVHVQIQDHDALQAPALLSVASADRQVIEDAVARAGAAVGVVRAPRHVPGQAPAAPGGPQRRHRPAHQPEGAGDDRGGPWTQADPASLLGAHLRGQEALHVVGIMRQLQQRRGDLRGQADPQGAGVGSGAEPSRQPLIALPREAGVGVNSLGVEGVVEERHALLGAGLGVQAHALSSCSEGSVIPKPDPLAGSDSRAP